MRNIKKSLSSALGLALVPVALSSGIANAADKLSYSYLEAEYVFGDELDLDIGGNDKFDVDGTRFKGSAGLTDNVFAWGSSTSLDVDLPSALGDTNCESQSRGSGRFPDRAVRNPVARYRQSIDPGIWQRNCFRFSCRASTAPDGQDRTTVASRGQARHTS